MIRFVADAHVAGGMTSARIVMRVVDQSAAGIIDVLAAKFDLLPLDERDLARDIDVILDPDGQPVTRRTTEVEQEALVQAARPTPQSEDVGHAARGRHLDVRALCAPSVVERAVGIGSAARRAARKQASGEERRRGEPSRTPPRRYG